MSHDLLSVGPTGTDLQYCDSGMLNGLLEAADETDNKKHNLLRLKWSGIYYAVFEDVQEEEETSIMLSYAHR
jgi:hypothetical protein